MALVGFTDILFVIPPETPPFLDPGLKWSDKTGKVFDVVEETA